MLITVAICTWNRACLLEKTLDRLCSVLLPEGCCWELIVVDNNSTDETDTVLNKYLGILPLKKVFERKQGHCFARNRAIEEARGEFLVWTDDDVLVDPDWLVEYVKVAQRWPNAGGFGGAVDPWLESSPPDWFIRNWDFIKGLFVIREYYETEFPTTEFPVGANMAVRMAYAKTHRFDENLGRVGSTLSGGDDCEWLERLARNGVQFAWAGRAKVKHFIPKERLTFDFLRRWFEGAGRTSVRINGCQPCKMLFGAPRWMWKKYLLSWLAMWCLRPLKNTLWMRACRKHFMLRGMIDEIRGD